MQKILNIKFFLLAFFLFALLIPVFANAGGLVPCGGCIGNEYIQDPNYPGDPDRLICANPEPDCQLCHFFVLIDNIIKFLLFPVSSNGGFPLVFLIATFMIVWAGVLYMIGYADNSQTISQAHGILRNTLIGLLIVYGAWILVNTVMTFTGLLEPDFNGWNPSEWYKIECSVPATP